MNKSTIIMCAVCGLSFALACYFALCWYESESAHFQRERVVSAAWQQQKLLRDILIVQSESSTKSQFLKTVESVQTRTPFMKEVPVVQKEDEIKFFGLQFQFEGEKLRSIQSENDQFFE
ncbi:MAG: hypothetical protein K2W95_29765 [Candidatus Obscuribacterales bacterium]|nr:hypothetical protein [Candidatus Obscuribacterales bacterium]